MGAVFAVFSQRDAHISISYAQNAHILSSRVSGGICQRGLVILTVVQFGALRKACKNCEFGKL